MKGNKITNVSNVKLEFFIKEENSEDKLVTLESGETCFSYEEEYTKSMKVFCRKKLLNIELGHFVISSNTVKTDNEAFLKIDCDRVLSDLKIDCDRVLSDINKSIVDLELSIVDELGDAKNKVLEYKNEEIPEVKEKRKYNYKKKPGRKKKPGPKPGSKRKTK